MDLVKRIQIRRDMENTWVMFDHVKHLKDWTTLAYYVYDSKYYKVLMIACSNMQSTDGRAQTLL